LPQVAVKWEFIGASLRVADNNQCIALKTIQPRAFMTEIAALAPFALVPLVFRAAQQPMHSSRQESE